MADLWTNLWALLFLALLSFCLALHILSLPANWLILALAGLWRLLHPESGLTWTLFATLGLLALVGEAVEFLAQWWGGKTYGAGSKANLAAVVGGVAGALLGAPFLFGLGALPGGLAGAWAACWAAERLRGTPPEQARAAAMGALLGKALGMVAKIALGAAMVALVAGGIWR